MASTSTFEVKIDDVHGEIDIWSIGKCVICNMQLTDIGVKCKCLTVTKSHLIEYPIGLLHLNINKDHNPNVMMTYPILKEFPVCPICTNAYTDVFCTQCSILLCQFCHLHSHHNHNYKLLEKFCKEITSNVLLEKFKLESNNKNLDFSLEEIEKQIENFKIEKQLFMKKLIKKQKVVLIKLENINKNTINTSEMTSKLEIDLKNNFDDTMNNCNSTIKELGNIIASPVFSLSKTNSINTSKNICQTFVNLQTQSFEHPKSKFPFQSTQEEVNTNNQINMDTENLDSEQCIYPVYVECACCLQLAEELIQCFRCERRYHLHCHVPALPEDMPNRIFWSCTMCKDFKFSKALELHKMKTSGVTIGEPERIIIERILMELFCESYSSVHFRESPSMRIYPTFYEKISNPINLNIIKNRFESNTYYTTLAHIIDDVKQVFLNALMFYHPTNEYYNSARILQNSLDTMISDWVPELNSKKK